MLKLYLFIYVMEFVYNVYVSVYHVCLCVGVYISQHTYRYQRTTLGSLFSASTFTGVSRN